VREIRKKRSIPGPRYMRPKFHVPWSPATWDELSGLPVDWSRPTEGPAAGRGGSTGRAYDFDQVPSLGQLVEGGSTGREGVNWSSVRF
jgi:hypothetical protein